MLTPGSRIDDRYEIVGTLGSGGMGHVYRARRLHLGDEVAIKVMQATHDSAPELRERFLRESRACAQLRHPNIVSLLDFGFDAGKQPYMVMELLSGPSLREEIQLEAPMTPARVASILRAVAAALQLAHDRGITHRDLKPANIVAHRYESGDRVYKVIDFGLAAMKAHNDETRLTDPAMFLGTLAYAAPEQMRGDAITPATDIYCPGVIAYEMLTGALPFDATNRVDAHQPDADDGADEAGAASQRVVRGDRRRGDACAGEGSGRALGDGAGVRRGVGRGGHGSTRFDQSNLSSADEPRSDRNLLARATSSAACSAAAGWAA